jgi:hypothetical protein
MQAVFNGPMVAFAQAKLPCSHVFHAVYRIVMRYSYLTCLLYRRNAEAKSR